MRSGDARGATPLTGVRGCAPVLLPSVEKRGCKGCNPLTGVRGCAPVLLPSLGWEKILQIKIDLRRD